MSERLGVALFVAVLGSFAAAVLLALFTSTPGRAIGALLVACGLAAVAFAGRLASAQRRLAEKPFIPRSWKNIRPFTFVLWGTGVVVLGVLQLFDF